MAKQDEATKALEKMLESMGKGFFVKLTASRESPTRDRYWWTLTQPDLVYEAHIVDFMKGRRQNTTATDQSALVALTKAHKAHLKEWFPVARAKRCKKCGFIPDIAATILSVSPGSLVAPVVCMVG